MERFADMYAILGVAADVDEETIRRVYRERARALRLDAIDDPVGDEQLRELTHAYEVLSNPRSRELYDGRRTDDRPTAADGSDEAALTRWVFGATDVPAEPAPSAPALTFRGEDFLTRSLASLGFVAALAFLLVLLLHG